MGLRARAMENHHGAVEGLADSLDLAAVDPSVRLRILEFLGARGDEPPTAVHLTRTDTRNPAQPERFGLDALDGLLEEGAGLARSLYDARSILVHLDIEFVNHDDPAAAFTDPWRAFRAQEPVVARVEELLSGWGIRPLHLITGQGHHFVWNFPRDSELARRIAHLVPGADKDGSEQVFANLGLVMEFMGHRILEVFRESVPPVEITAVQVPPGAEGARELVSVDLSEYGDPLESRCIRIPFTRYLKPWSSGIARRHGIEGQIGPCFCIPLHEMDAMQALKARQDGGDIASLARRCVTAIPDEEEGTSRLFLEYLDSPLRSFHRRFYECDHDPPESWPLTYGRTPMEELPCCVRRILREPNELLLKPSGIRLVTRVLLAKGWHPRHIAGLVRSKFEDPAHGWGGAWRGYSPGFRADFYVRLFSGLIATGLDSLTDFSCAAQASEGFCWPGSPPCDLASLVDALRPQRGGDASLAPNRIDPPSDP
jgi:hypothetical protein